jgi:hypothetical protein
MPAPFELIAGPLTLWLAPVGTAFPVINVGPAAPWVRIGTNGDANYDDDGMTISNTVKQEIYRPAGRTGPTKAFTTEEDFMIGLKLNDLTLEQYSYAVNKAAVVTVAAAAGVPGTKTLGLTQGADVVEYALLARITASPYADGMNLQFMVPRVFQSGNIKQVWKKGKPVALDLEFTALENLAATAPQFRFGSYQAQHQLPI